MKIYILLFIFFITSTSAIGLDINCPEEVYAQQEFECKIKIQNVTETWDLKTDITNNGERIAQIYNNKEKKWQSSYYYLKKFINKENDYIIKLKIIANITEKIPATIKLRKNNKIETFDFDIRLGIPPKAPNIKNTSKILINTSKTLQNTSKTNPEPIKTATKPEKKVIKTTPQIDNTKTIINKNEIKYTGEVVYESTNSKLKDYTIYGFCGLLIIVITILLFEKNGKSNYDC